MTLSNLIIVFGRIFIDHFVIIVLSPVPKSLHCLTGISKIVQLHYLKKVYKSDNEITLPIKLTKLKICEFLNASKKSGHRNSYVLLVVLLYQGNLFIFLFYLYFPEPNL